MGLARTTIVLALSAAVAMAACNRTQPANEEVREDAAATERQEHDDEAVRLESRVAELEREYKEMEARLAKETAGPTNELKAEVKEDLTRVREAVADLKTTNADNWWERHERVMEQNLDDVEQDVKRFARRWTAPKPEAEVGTAGEAAGWQAERNRLADRLEARIDAMEEALKDVDLRGAQETEVEDTRARVKKMREDADRLRKASEDDWWEISRERVSEYIDRVERSIKRLDNDTA